MDQTTRLTSDDWIVVAWHTRDEKYTSLARRLGDQLSAFGAPHVMYDVDRGNRSWIQTIKAMKPVIVQRALDEHPGKIIVLMDVDCHIHARLEPLVERVGTADLAINLMRKRKRGLTSGNCYVTTRVMGFNDTARTKALLQYWGRICRTSVDDGETEETLLAHAITEGPCNVHMVTVPAAYGGLETHDAPPRAAITHVSANAETHPAWKHLEQRIRIGFRKLSTL